MRPRRVLLFWTALTVLLPIAPAAGSGSAGTNPAAGWTQFGGDAAHRYDGSDLGVNPAKLRLDWRYSPGRAGLHGHGLEAAVQGGTVYIASGTNNPAPPRTPAAVRALDLRTGRLKWQTPMRAAGDSFIYARPAVSHGVVVVNGTNDEGEPRTALSGYRAADGRLLWRLPIPAVTVEPPSVAGRTAYITTRDGPADAAYAVDIVTGQVRWQRPVPLQLSGPFTLTAGRLIMTGLSTPAAGCATGRCLDGLDPATGRLLWRRPVPVNFGFPGDLVGYHGAVIGTDPDRGTACAYAATNGARRWCIPIGRWPATAPTPGTFGPVVTNGVLYAGFGRLTEASAATGRLLRRVPLPAGIAGGVVDDGRLLALANNPLSPRTPARLLILDAETGRRLADLGQVDTTQTDGRISVVPGSVLITGYGQLTTFRAPALASSS